MDKTAIKNFAINARRKLIADTKLKAAMLGITEEEIASKLATSTSEIEYYVDDRNPITGSDIGKRQRLVTELLQRATNSDLKTAFNDLVEEIAYTWFNRLIAIRFMEVNDYLPSRTRVLSSSQGRHEPDIMIDPIVLEPYLGHFTDEELGLIKVAQETELTTDMDRLYRMLFIKQANALYKNLPHLFEKTNDYAELLFTPNYHDGVIQQLITTIPVADFDVAQGGQVEIIGWLYQYYNTEPHNYAVNITGGAVTKNEIPAATQLFTTDWVVRYMVDNSLGRYWLERHPESKLATKLNFLLPSKITSISDNETLENIQFIDNAMGSGHVLIYAFEVFMRIYLEEGYSARDAAKSILKHNLFGLEIDKRAYQLAYFAVMMKARQYNRRALSDEDFDPNIFVFEDSNTVTAEFFDALDETHRVAIHEIVELFSNARELGSIIQLQQQYNWNDLNQAVHSVPTEDLDVFGIQQSKELVLRIIKIAQVMSEKYAVAVTNPPYLNKFDPELKKYIKQNFKDYSGDLFSVFIYNNINMVQHGGYSAYMTPFVWMFIKTYEKLRKYIVEQKEISSLIQMEYSAFEEATVPINTFILKNVPNNEEGTYIKLSSFKGGMDVQRDKVLEAIQNPDSSYLYRTNQANFSKIPGSPIAYWASDNLIHDFEIGTPMDNLVNPKVGLQTGDNKRFLRMWYEVDNQRISFHSKSIDESIQSNKKWFPCNKGGAYRKWYGNYDYVVNWENDGYEIRNFKNYRGQLKSRPQNTNYYFREAITWPKITSGKFNVRYREIGSIHETAGNEAFATNHNMLIYILGALNTKVANQIILTLNPTINSQVGDFNNIPVIINNDVEIRSQILSRLSISTSKMDWDSFETSWDFTRHPLSAHIADDKQKEIGGKLENAFGLWKVEAQQRFDQLKANEEELNRIFIDLYGLNDELTPDVADKDVSVRLADEVRDIKSFLSYFVGVVFGRYSLDVEGLVLAGGKWNSDNYQKFVPNQDNLVMLNDERYFNDDRDIINRLEQFLEVVFGMDTLQANLDYIARIVGKKAENSEAAIRRYFVEDFFKDHKKVYQKKPIYWEFSSGRQNGFKALMYLHRYDNTELAMIRTDYLHPLQGKYETRLSQLQQLSADESMAKRKKQLERDIKHVNQQINELKSYDPIIQHLANEQISLDLDDGVSVNYSKLQDGEKVLSKI
ncbi:restriction endonuclease subunit M [Lactobacillus sp. CBA3606]|nr:BREX-1 system adenine-specific DNA-methyltransferase PglX [Lactobacillus sp. CBA3606]AVK63725.1 restriction endonuclease subunit M [Lactobacillus sp. CBA3606]